MFQRIRDYQSYPLHYFLNESISSFYCLKAQTSKHDNVLT